MHLFRIEKNNFSLTGYLKIEGADFTHIKKVLRKKEGNYIFITDGEFIYKSRILRFERNSLLAEIIIKNKVPEQKKMNITLFAGLVRFSSFELLLDYAVQLGVTEIYPLISEFTQNIVISTERAGRWKRIINETSKQSFNPIPPVLNEPISFKKAVKFPGFKVLLHPYSDISIKDVLKTSIPDKIDIYIGPEAGFSDEEIKIAYENKINIVKLPYNILKSETMALSLLSNIIFFYQ